MKWLYIFLLTLVPLISSANEYQELSKELRIIRDEFKAEPSMEQLEKAEQVFEEMVQINEMSYNSSYGTLIQVYLSAGSIVGRVEAYEKAISVVDRYIAVDRGRQRNIYQFRLSLIEDMERVKLAEGLPAGEKSPSQKIGRVKLAQELIARNREKKNAKELKQARGQLKAEIYSSRSIASTYLDLFEVYVMENTLEKAFATWQIASQFGESENPKFQEATKLLYQIASEYEGAYGVSEDSPGPDRSRFFIWINREKIAKCLEKGSRKRGRSA